MNVLRSLASLTNIRRYVLALRAAFQTGLLAHVVPRWNLGRCVEEPTARTQRQTCSQAPVVVRSNAGHPYRLCRVSRMARTHGRSLVPSTLGAHYLVEQSQEAE